ncbi:MAG TPA: PHP-associated domain-containing protein [Salinivirgaceae bacterium]|nr:PHP-associated domain-containing protein [Salinivirgaceae bacterium]
MLRIKADMHIHTVLSPCGDLDMSPRNILIKAKEKGLDLIAITDHNSTLMCRVIANLASEYDIAVIPGVEITTKEEAHCLAYFHDYEQINQIQMFLEQHLPPIQNNPDLFGHQLVVDQDEMILQEINTLLITALNLSIDEIEKTVHKIGGIFIPAHIDRPKYSIISQLGFIPFDLNAEAFELSRYSSPDSFTAQNKPYRNFIYVQNSDAHYLENIADAYTIFEIENPTLEEIVKALKNLDGRKIVSTHNQRKTN